ncbi:hypothetical protein BDW69DRAFT_109964 [Aspergillus filifer]
MEETPIAPEDEGPSISMLREELGFHKDDNTADIDECLEVAEITPKQRRQVSVLTKQDAFQRWLKEEAGSAALVAYGNLEIDDYISPLSYLSARIGKQYYGKRGYIVLSYACGLHSRSAGYGWSEAVATMIGQLLLQAGNLLDLKGIMSRHDFKGFKKRNLHTLTTVFASLIGQLRSSRVVLFCLIDSISFYEATERERETKEVLSTLRRLVESMRPGKRDTRKGKMVFKLLISEALTSEIAHKYVKRDEVVEMSEDAEEASGDDLQDGSESLEEVSAEDEA